MYLLVFLLNMAVLLDTSALKAYLDNNITFQYQRDAILQDVYTFNNEADNEFSKRLFEIAQMCNFFYTKHTYPDFEEYEALYDAIFSIYEKSPFFPICTVASIFKYSKHMQTEMYEMHDRMLRKKSEFISRNEMSKCQLKGTLFLKYAEFAKTDNGRWMKLVKSIISSVEKLYNLGNFKSIYLDNDAHISYFTFIVKHLILSSDIDRLYVDKHLKFSNKYINQKYEMCIFDGILAEMESLHLKLEPEFLEYSYDTK